MRRRVRLYFILIGARVRSEMQYRAAFGLELLGNVVLTSLDFVGLVILLHRFGSIGDWTLPEVAFLYGTSSLSFTLAEILSGGYQGFDTRVRMGDFDRLLTRPLPLGFQVITSDLQLRHLGRLTQGAVAFGWALSELRPAWGLLDGLFLILMLVSGSAIFLGIFIAGASTAFWSPQTGELTNVFSYGGQAMTSYPMQIYPAWMRRVFTFFLPMAFINYLPSLHLLGKSDPWNLPSWLPFLTPLAAGLTLAASLVVWRRGVRRYQSTGS